MSKVKGETLPKKEAWTRCVEIAQEKNPLPKTRFQNNLLFHPKHDQTGKLFPALLKATGLDFAQKNKDPFEATTKTSRKPNCFTNAISRILQTWADEESNVRLAWTSLAIVAFSLIAAGIFYAVEKDSGCEWTYWRSLWLVNTIFTTIGYGTLHPCTMSGRIATVAFAFLGIPLNVFALADIGRLLARFLAMLWNKVVSKLIRRVKRRFAGCTTYIRSQFVCFENNSKASATVDDDGTVADAVSLPINHFSLSDIPLWFALVITFLWVISSALFFTLTEPENMTFGDSLYFIMISITTIGFGDVVPSKYDLVVFQFFFIIIGISLFSMVISIVQEKVYSLSDNVESLIGREYAAAQIDGVALPSNEEQAREHIKRIIRKQKGGLGLRLVMSKRMEDKLIQDYMLKTKKQLVATQTDNDMDDKEITCKPDTRSVRLQAWFADVSIDEDVSPTAVDNGTKADSGTQVMWVPKGSVDLEWLDLSRAAHEKQKQRKESQSTTKSKETKTYFDAEKWRQKKASLAASPTDAVSDEKYNKISNWLNS